jgi:hypothetical protein
MTANGKGRQGAFTHELHPDLAARGHACAAPRGPDARFQPDRHGYRVPHGIGVMARGAVAATGVGREHAGRMAGGRLEHGQVG